MENDKGEKEILIDAQSFQFGYRAAVKDMVGEPRGAVSPVVTFFACFAIFYVLFVLFAREK